jgi:uncharacterized protein
MRIPERFSNLLEVMGDIDFLLGEVYPDFFGDSPEHPRLPVRRKKIIHDAVWGTHQFEWQELAAIDSPLLQRLRDIHQVGLAYLTYPSGQHTRFEHCLGTAIVSSRIFDSLRSRKSDDLRTVVDKSSPGDEEWEKVLVGLQADLRMAALLHDTGHSLFSHASEAVFSQVPGIRDATRELSDMVGKGRSAGELISFCIAQSPRFQRFIRRCGERVFHESAVVREEPTTLDFDNISLLIVGRARHPALQFLGDIISSGFDADKLDYLIRDSKSCGLAITYDLDRYLAFVDIVEEDDPEKAEEQKLLYEEVLSLPPLKDSGLITEKGIHVYRLRIPRSAITCVEQVVIDKFMLYSYIYHHPKVRSAEGLLERTFSRTLGLAGTPPPKCREVIRTLLKTTDSMFLSAWQAPPDASKFDRKVSYMLYTRLLPRVVYSLGGQVGSPSEKKALNKFVNQMTGLERLELKAQLERGIGEELQKLRPGQWPTWDDALYSTGCWVDAPKPLNFEDTRVLLPVDSPYEESQSFGTLFPIAQWGISYLNHVHRIRVYAYSEYMDPVSSAARTVLKSALKIYSDKFFDVKVRRDRPWS